MKTIAVLVAVLLFTGISFAEIIAEKIDGNTMQVTKTTDTPEPTVTIYTYEFLIAQKASIATSAKNYLALRQKELDEVNALLEKCTELGITAKEMPLPIKE